MEKKKSIVYEEKTYCLYFNTDKGCTAKTDKGCKLGLHVKIPGLCRFVFNCTIATCTSTHDAGREKPAGAKCQSKEWMKNTPCRSGPACTKVGCGFVHPDTAKAPAKAEAPGGTPAEAPGGTPAEAPAKAEAPVEASCKSSYGAANLSLDTPWAESDEEDEVSVLRPTIMIAVA